MGNPASCGMAGRGGTCALHPSNLKKKVKLGHVDVPPFETASLRGSGTPISYNKGALNDLVSTSQHSGAKIEVLLQISCANEFPWSYHTAQMSDIDLGWSIAMHFRPGVLTRNSRRSTPFSCSVEMSTVVGDWL